MKYLTADPTLTRSISFVYYMLLFSFLCDAALTGNICGTNYRDRTGCFL